MSLGSAFRWRHRFLEKVVVHQLGSISGLLEVDETYFQISHKSRRELDRPRGQAFTVDKVLTDMSKGRFLGCP